MPRFCPPEAKTKKQGSRYLKSGFLLLSFFTCINLKSQDSIKINQLRQSLSTPLDDTARVNALRQLGKLYSGIFMDSTFYFTRQALALATSINWRKGIAQNLLNLGSYFSSTSVYDSALYYDNRALDVAKQDTDKNRLSLIYSNRSNVFTETQQYDKAMDDIRQSLVLAEATGNKDRQARSYQAMCELYMYQENFAAAMPWAQKALDLDREIGNEDLESVAEMSLGGAYALRKEFQKAESYCLDAIQKATKTNRPDIVVECYISLTDIYTSTKQYEKVDALVKKGVALARQFNLVDPIAVLYLNHGEALYLSKKYAEALAAYQNGYNIIEGKTAFQSNQFANLEGMAKSYAALGNYKSACDAADLAYEIKDSALKKRQDKKLLSLQAQFETERKEKQIELLQKDQQLNLATMQRHQAEQYAVWIIIGLLAVAGFVAINRYRSVQRAKRLMEIEQMRHSIARDLHDDIGSTLTSINILSEVTLQQSAETNAASTHLRKIKDRSGDIIERMNDIVWAINPANDVLNKIILRMKELGAEIVEEADMQFDFKEEGDLSNARLSLAQRNNLYLVYKEALNNAVKYSQAKKVTAVLSKKGAHLIFEITDNGKGFDNGQLYSGNGLKNMQGRAADMKASFQLQSTPGLGTTIRLVLPVV